MCHEALIIVVADEGGQAIGDMLTANHTLKKLLLSSNLLGEAIMNYGEIKYSYNMCVPVVIKITF